MTLTVFSGSGFRTSRRVRAQESRERHRDVRFAAMPEGPVSVELQRLRPHFASDLVRCSSQGLTSNTLGYVFPVFSGGAGVRSSPRLAIPISQV